MLDRIRKVFRILNGSNNSIKILKPQAHWALIASTGILTRVIEHGGDRVTVTLDGVNCECKDLRQFKYFPRSGTLVSIVLCKPDEDGLQPLLWVYEGDAKAILEEENRRHWIAG